VASDAFDEVQDLMRGLSASTGLEHSEQRDVTPFISGTFEYGVGRPAAKRKVQPAYFHFMPVSGAPSLLSPLLAFLAESAR
jgi:hypothetical protein